MNKTVWCLLACCCLLSACSVKSALNPYDEDFHCRAKDKEGRCTDTPGAYKDARYPRPSSVKVEEEPKRQNFGRTAKDEEKEVPPVSLKEEAKASQYQAISSMLTEPRPPMVVPPKVIKVLILPYQGSKGELFMSRYVYLQMEKSSWILTDTKEKR